MWVWTEDNMNESEGETLPLPLPFIFPAERRYGDLQVVRGIRTTNQSHDTKARIEIWTSIGRGPLESASRLRQDAEGLPVAGQKDHRCLCREFVSLEFRKYPNHGVKVLKGIYCWGAKLYAKRVSGHRYWEIKVSAHPFLKELYHPFTKSDIFRFEKHGPANLLSNPHA